MKRLFPALAVSLALTLSACGGGGTTPPDTTGGTTPGGNGSSSTFTVQAAGPSTTLKSGDETTIQITVTPTNGFTGNVTAELINAPAGVTAAPVTMTINGTTTLKLTVQTGSAAGLLTIPVQVRGGGVTQKDDAYAFVYRVVTLPSGNENCSFPDCRFPAGAGVIADGTYWTVGAANTSAADSVVSVNMTTGTTNSYKLGLGGSTYGAAYAQRSFWAGVNRSGRPAVLAGIDPTSGSVRSVEVGPVNGVIIDVQSLPDGRLVFLHQLQASSGSTWSIGLFDPATGAVTLTPAAPQGQSLFGLSVGPGGTVWTTRGYADPALVRFNPATQELKAFSIGTENNNLALTVAATSDDKVWFQDTRTAQLRILNPMTGVIQNYRSAPALNQLYPAGDGVFALNNQMGSVALNLLAPSSTGVDAFNLPLRLGKFNNIGGFTADRNGSLGYVSSGEAYLLPAN